MKLYVYNNKEFWHKCIEPLYRSVYICQDGYFKCVVCTFRFPSILTLGSENIDIMTRVWMFRDEKNTFN